MEFFRRLFGIKHEHIWQTNDIYERTAYNSRGEVYKYHRVCIECGKEQFKRGNSYTLGFEWEDKELNRIEKRDDNINKLLK